MMMMMMMMMMVMVVEAGQVVGGHLYRIINGSSHLSMEILNICAPTEDEGSPFPTSPDAPSYHQFLRCRRKACHDFQLMPFFFLS